MAGALRCLVLGREPSGESHLLLTVLDAEEGASRCLVRARAAGKSERPDLFDDAEITLEPAKGGANRFARDYRLTRRRAGIGRSPAALERASRLCNLIRRNPPPPESAPVALQIAREALDAMAARPRPDAAYLKALWLLLKDGGWPVEADWLGRLGSRATAAADVLSRPLDGQVVDASGVAALTEDLERWAAGEVHYILP